MITERINPTIKINHARWGEPEVFGHDADERKRFSDDELLGRFSDVWQARLQAEVRDALPISPDEARELLGSLQFEGYVQHGFEFRQLDVNLVPFLARVRKGLGGAVTCDQLWFLGKHKDSPRLTVTFDT